MEDLAKFVARLQGLSLEDLQARLPDPVLLLEGAGPAPESGEVFLTRDGKPTRSREEEAAAGTGAAPPAPGGEAPAAGAVLRLVKVVKTVFPSRITVGRAGDSDILLNRSSVSKQHAFFTKDSETGSYWLTDAGSRNGTRVNGNPVGPGQRVALSDGDRVNFGGDVEFSYFTPRGLHPYLPVLARRLLQKPAGG
ncbi:MAG: FHA domain-containing protein [Planctomycetales bacterium]|nr:FHA domain-containing protein [Planctomycetales bacterium]